MGFTSSKAVSVVYFYPNGVGETDIATIKRISKGELLSFVDKYIHPSSPHRSVLLVRVQSQVEKQLPSSEDRLVADVRVFLAGEGYDIPPSEVEEAVKMDTSLIEQNLRDLMLKRGYDQERVAQTLGKPDLLNAQVVVNGRAMPNVLKEVTVNDLEFRNTLKLDNKPVPIQPLETFYVSKGS